jgi:choline dehydrogenase
VLDKSPLSRVHESESSGTYLGRPNLCDACYSIGKNAVPVNGAGWTPTPPHLRKAVLSMGINGTRQTTVRPMAMSPKQASAQTDFDDVIIGAGSSGAALSARLATAGRRVLLAEAGPDYPDPSRIAPDLWNGNTPSLVQHDWGFVGIRGNGRELPLPRGRVVGGSSAINSCIALRPQPDDFADWSGWSWPEVLPFFCSLETDADFHGPHHGTAGPLRLQRRKAEQWSSISAALMETAAAEGFPPAIDHNAPDATGVGPVPLNRTDAGQRISTATAFLDPVRDNPNLTILPNAVADKVLFAGPRATGVRLIVHGRPRIVRAERVTLCAGTYGTPVILQRSGVGPAELVRGLGNAVIADLPGVGANLADHSQVAIGVLPRPGLCDPADPCAEVVLRYRAPDSIVSNDMQLYALNHVELSLFAPHLMRRAPDGRAFMLTSNLMAPRGRGTVRAVTADPTAPPRIELDYVNDPEDLRRQRAGVRLCWELLHQPTFRSLTHEILDVDGTTVRLDAALNGFIRRSVTTAHHPTGTASYGPSDDPMAVVDDRGRVYGTEGLRVADASIIPVSPRANTNLASIMIGERVATWSH